MASLLSIEHDRAWATKVNESVRARMPTAVVRGWALRHVARGAASLGGDESGVAFSAYVNATLPRDSFDFVSVDGRARSACLERVWNEGLVAPGGLLLLDNSYRAKYRAARARFDENWVKVEFDAAKIVHPDAATALWCRNN